MQCWLSDTLAMAAMQGMLANSGQSKNLMPFIEMNSKGIAEYAVSQADALLAELEKTEEAKWER